MGRYFGREPRYSREEIERQAQEAIDARVSLGRPPAEDWRPLEARLEEADRALVSRPLPEPQPQPRPQTRPQPEPIRISKVRLPTSDQTLGAPVRSTGRRPVAARQSPK